MLGLARPDYPSSDPLCSSSDSAMDGHCSNYISLPKDKRGEVAKQLPLVSVVDHPEEWQRLIVNVEVVTWAIVSDQMVYKQRLCVLQGSWMRNDHPS